MSPRLLIQFVAFNAALSVGAPARAQLAALSPFMPPAGSRGSSAPTSNAPLEFRGVADLPGGPAFRVVDPARKSGAWVHLNEPDPELGFVVKQHDAEHETVVVEHQGRTYTLSLHQSKVSSAGAPQAMQMTPQNLLLPPSAATAAVAAQPAVPIQQAQLDAVAAAVAQRRALREQAQQQVSQGVPLAPQVIQQQQQQRAQNAQNAAAQTQADQNNQNGQNGGQRKKNRQP